MPSQDIVVIGGSAGSIESLRKIVENLPPDFPGTIFVVIHVSPDSSGLLPNLLSRTSHLQVSGSQDLEQFEAGHIYIARPDHHVTLDDHRMRVQRGPRENRHRPAIDPLFRTAARVFGPRVVGIVLSGLQDDGSAGLYAVKQRGGMTIVQEPNDAPWKDMPINAIEYADPHYVIPAKDMGSLLIELAKPQGSEAAMVKKNHALRKSNVKNRKFTDKKQRNDLSGTQEADANKQVAYPDEGEGTPSVFACPECHGVLWELKDGKMTRFRCRVGHSYGTESLSKELSAASEAALWAAVRALEEKSSLHRRVAEGMRMDASMSLRMLDQASTDDCNARIIREMIFHRDAELETEQEEPAIASEQKKSA